MKRISSGSTFEEKIGYSRAVDDGHYIHVSGTTGYDYETMSIPDSVEAQAQQAVDNILNALEKAGVGLEQVVRVNYIFPNRDDFEPCWPIFKAAFGATPPAATMIVAELLDPEMKLEIEVTALSVRQTQSR